MRIKAYEWDEHNIEHIARHGVNPEEVEEACHNRPYVLAGRESRYLIYGQTDDGRYILTVGVYRGKGVMRVITARDMTEAEKKIRHGRK